MTADEMKKVAAIEALKFVKPGMNVGLGTGSTANHFIEALGQKVKEGLNVKGVPTSKASKELAEKYGIPLTNLDAQPHLDLTVDGTDEFDAEFRLIKGGGGALLFEKIVASSSRIMVVIADKIKEGKNTGQVSLACRSHALWRQGYGLENGIRFQSPESGCQNGPAGEGGKTLCH